MKHLPFLAIILMLASCTDDEPKTPWANVTWVPASDAEAHVEMPLIYVGNRESTTVMLVVHGGPGISSLDYLGTLEKQLGNDVLLAFWDQRYSGFSQFDFTRSMTIADNLDDGYAVVQQIKQKYPGKKVVLWGHDWGTTLVMGLVTHPIYKTEIDGWIVNNGIVSGFEGFNALWNFTVRRCQEKINAGQPTYADTIVALNRLKPEPGRWRINTLARVYTYAIRLGVPGEPRQSRDERDYQKVRERNIFPNLTDRKRVDRNGLLAVNGISFSELWKPVLDELVSPGLLIWGQNDNLAPVELQQWLVDQLTQRGKVFTAVTYEGAWHSPHVTQPDKHQADVKSFIQQLP
jgi:pimeloyl-ACP methyl ester carboxylesterase